MKQLRQTIEMFAVAGLAAFAGVSAPALGADRPHIDSIVSQGNVPDGGVDFDKTGTKVPAQLFYVSGTFDDIYSPKDKGILCSLQGRQFVPRYKVYKIKNGVVPIAVAQVDEEITCSLKAFTKSDDSQIGQTLNTTSSFTLDPSGVTVSSSVGGPESQSVHSASGGDAASGATFRSDANKVNIDATVRYPKGHKFGGQRATEAKQEMFEYFVDGKPAVKPQTDKNGDPVLQNGQQVMVPVPVESFSNSDTPEPTNVAILIDFSGSMHDPAKSQYGGSSSTTKLEFAREAAKVLIDNLDPKYVNFFVVHFNEWVVINDDPPTEDDTRPVGATMDKMYAVRGDPRVPLWLNRREGLPGLSFDPNRLQDTSKTLPDSTNGKTFLFKALDKTMTQMGKAQTFDQEVRRKIATSKNLTQDQIIAKLQNYPEIGHDKKVIWIVTDGIDNSKDAGDLGAVRKKAVMNSIQINAIGVFGSKEDAAFGRKILDHLTRSTGGRAYYPDTFDKVSQAAKEFADDLQHQYHFTVPVTEYNGCHTVKVRARNNDLIAEPYWKQYAGDGNFDSFLKWEDQNGPLYKAYKEKSEKLAADRKMTLVDYLLKYNWCFQSEAERYVDGRSDISPHAIRAWWLADQAEQRRIEAEKEAERERLANTTSAYSIGADGRLNPETGPVDCYQPFGVPFEEAKRHCAELKAARDAAQNPKGSDSKSGDKGGKKEKEPKKAPTPPAVPPKPETETVAQLSSDEVSKIMNKKCDSFLGSYRDKLILDQRDPPSGPSMVERLAESDMPALKNARVIWEQRLPKEKPWNEFLNENLEQTYYDVLSRENFGNACTQIQ